VSAPTPAAALEPLERRLGALLANGRRRRVTLEELWQHLYALEPRLRTAAEKRNELERTLAALAAAGAVELPKTQRLYDRSERPPLPRWVLAGEARPPSSAASTAEARAFAWRPELAFAADLAAVTADELGFLQAVNGFLRDCGTARPLVPVQERSLGLLGDEKQLERFVRGRLFARGRLSLDLLRCTPAPPPFIWVPVDPHAVTLLVVENTATFRTLQRLLAPGDGVAALAYGGGAQFVQSAAFARELPFAFERIHYFGDVDPTGLNAPAEASKTARRAGLPPVEPDHELYRLLFEHGRPSPAKENPPPARAAELAAWLPAEWQDAATELLLQGRRLAQEWVGFELLGPHFHSARA
jgi:hypothetical protein